MHHCHAHKCEESVPIHRFVCVNHWFRLPRQLQAAVYREYRKGQEITKTPSARYMAVQQWCIGILAFKPHDEKAALISAYYLLKACQWRDKAIADKQGDPLKGIATDGNEEQSGTL